MVAGVEEMETVPDLSPKEMGWALGLGGRVLGEQLELEKEMGRVQGEGLDLGRALGRVLGEGLDPDLSFGSGIMQAFEMFKKQMKDLLSANHRRMEARSMQGWTDCQQNISSLLNAIHNQKLASVERFQSLVLKLLGQLEVECSSLNGMETELVSFWQTQTQTVKTFCEQQQRRLGVFGQPGSDIQCYPI